MQIAVIGTGGIGSALATLFARHGHSVILGTRNPDGDHPLARELGVRAVDYRAAAASAELVCFCVPWEHAAATARQLGDLSGKIIIDPSNPEASDGESLLFGHSSSGAEVLASWFPRARLVKAFNYVYAELLRDPQALAERAPSIFLCGDDRSANRVVAGLVTTCGLEAIDCGPLRSARYLEPLAMLMVHLVRKQGWPPARVAMKLSHG